MIVGEACFGGAVASKGNPQQSSQSFLYFRLGRCEDALEQVVGQDPATLLVAEARAPASGSWIWMFREAQDVFRQVSRLSQKGEVLVRGARLDNGGGGGRSLHDVRKIQIDFDHLLRFPV